MLRNPLNRVKFLNILLIIIASSVAFMAFAFMAFDMPFDGFRLDSIGATFSKYPHSQLAHVEHFKADTWGVITTIFEVNEAVKFYAESLPNHGLIIVGDKKSPHDEWETFASAHPNAFYLSPEAQLESSFARQVPWNHFGRKSIGYMFAIQNGAEKIYDFDDDNHLSGADVFSKLDTFSKFAPAKSHHVYNPYMFFEPKTQSGEQAFSWPRGQSLQWIEEEKTYQVAHGPVDSMMPKIAVIQSLANHDPDVDAIYRFTRPLPVTFTKKHTMVVTHRGVFTPWNAQSVLFYRVAFWGMLLPITVTGRVSDIWRSYITSRLLWEIDHTVAFSSPIVTQYRNPHSYKADFEDEHDLYHKTDTMLATLAKWTSGSHVTVDTAYLDLMSTLEASKLISNEDVRLAKLWVDELTLMDYKWPEIVNRLPRFELSDRAIVDERKKGNKRSEEKPSKDKDKHTNTVAVQSSNHCYRGRGNWTECVGSHLLYKPSTPAELLARRPVMCAYEPFCWKQLDWRHTDPPTWFLKTGATFNIYDLTIHDTVMGDPATVIEKALNPRHKDQHSVFLCNEKGRNGNAIKNYKHNFKLCPNLIPVPYRRKYGVGQAAFTESYKANSDFQKADMLIAGFPGDLFMYVSQVGKPMIVNAGHRIDSGYGKNCDGKEKTKLFEEVKALNRSKQILFGAERLYDVYYTMHYTGVVPLFLPSTLAWALEGISWTGTREEILFNGHAPLPKKLSNSKFTFVKPRHYTLQDLAAYQGVVVYPYSITNGKSVEQYVMNIPMFVPSQTFVVNMMNDRTGTYGPYCPGLTPSQFPSPEGNSPFDFNPNVRIDKDGNTATVDVKFWDGFADFYHWPCVQTFESWGDLLRKLAATNFREVSECMQQANKWRKFESSQNWALALHTMAQNHETG